MRKDNATSTTTIQQSAESRALINLSSFSLNEQNSQLRDIFSQRPIIEEHERDDPYIVHQYDEISRERE
jgi:hypothetical protein